MVFRHNDSQEKAAQAEPESPPSAFHAELHQERPGPGNSADITRFSNEQVPPVDLWKQYGSQDNFMKQAPIEMRNSYGLEPNASSEKLFRTIAREVSDAYNNSPPDVRRLLMQNHGMVTFPKTFDDLVKKLADNDRAELKLKPDASFSDIEKARNEAIWKKRYMPVDTD